MKLRLRPPTLSAVARPRRSNTNRPNYNEDSSAETEIDETSTLRRSLRNRSRPSNRLMTPPETQPSSPKRKISPLDADSQDIESPRRKKKARLGATITRSPRKMRKHPQSASQVDMDAKPGASPAWETLPYHILVNIFYHSSQPFYDKYFRANSSIHWLVDAATVCKAFYEPAVAALYRSPPLLPQIRAHKLVNFLSTPRENTMLDYTSKIQRIELEVYKGLITKCGSHGYLDLADLIRKVPQLKELYLYNFNDRVLGEPSMTHNISGRWTYPKSMFEALEETNIRLRAFEWNGSFAKPDQLIEEMDKVHQLSSFQSIQDLTLVDFNLALESTPSYQNLEESLASTLTHLRNLRHLKFQNCTLVDEYLLPKLPTSLESLTFNNCDNLSSLNLKPFLESHGSQLKDLVLDHNSSLNLSFLTQLATSCPRLQVLKMDLHFHSQLALTHDSEPRFDVLLHPHENPTWPSTLQILEFNQLRKWESEGAEAFFGSLLDSASDLMALRKLVIKAIVNIGWRDRAKFREIWIGRLEHVFMRHSSAPDNSLRSLAAYRKFHTQLKESLEAKERERKEKRRSNRIAQREDQDFASTSFSFSDKGSLSGRRSNSVKSPHTPPETRTMSPKHSRDDSPEKLESLFIQGLCNAVAVRIDNLRPAESMFTEADFLDDEPDDDGDWDGQDPRSTANYAW